MAQRAVHWAQAAQAVITTIGLLAGGAWLLMNFAPTEEMSAKKASLEKQRVALETEKVTLEAQTLALEKQRVEAETVKASAMREAKINVAVQASPFVIEGRRFIAATVTLSNTGNVIATLHLRKHLRFYAARVDAVGKTHPDRAKKLPLRLDYPDQELYWLSLRPGAHPAVVSTARRVLEPGLYIVRFRVPESAKNEGLHFFGEAYVRVP